MELIFDLMGWLGAGLLLLSYWLLTTKRVNATGFRYHLANFAGGSLLLVNNLHYGAYPSGFVNFVWLIIAALAVFRLVDTASRRPHCEDGITKTASVKHTAGT